MKVYKDFSAQAATSGNGNNKSAESAGGRGRSGLLKDLEREECYEGLEVWSLSDVVFLDDSPAVLGRVVTVDQLQAIVDISHASTDAGTMESLSAAQSTLKVFKLSDIEPCIDKTHLPGGARCHTPSRDEGGGKGLDEVVRSKSGGRSLNEGSLAVSQHIAGVVQHRPACLLTPLPLPGVPHPPPHHHHRDSDSTPNHTPPPPCTCVHGHYPLAVHSTDNGPIMLVKRVSDGTAFLVCSGHTGFPSFASSSFVSLSSRDGRPGRSTIDEESVPAHDSGLDRASWTCPPLGDAGLADKTPATENAESAKTRGARNAELAKAGRAKHAKSAKVGGARNTESAKVGVGMNAESAKVGVGLNAESAKVGGGMNAESAKVGGAGSVVAVGSVSNPCFVQFHKSDAIVLQDANGIVCPLLEGLRLRPSALPSQQHGGGGRGSRPLQPYKCIVTRSQLVKKDVTVLIVVVGECGISSETPT